MTKHAELETGRAVWQRQRVAGNPPLPRHGHTCTVVDRRRLVVFGGASAHDETLLNDLHVLDFEDNRWCLPRAEASFRPRGTGTPRP